MAELRHNAPKRGKQAHRKKLNLQLIVGRMLIADILRWFILK
jgi:hypothetical protein